jgi:hypothetical protein
LFNWPGNANAAWRQADLYPVTGRELEAVDIPAQHERSDGSVAAEGDAGQRPGLDDSLHVCSQANGGWRLTCHRAELDVFGPVKDLNGAVQAWRPVTVDGDGATGQVYEGDPVTPLIQVS